MAAADGSPLVLVTGASGYIATHVIKQLQEEGYRVRGTVRSLQDENKVKHLHALCPEAQFKLELVEADLTKPESWEAAVKDVVYVIHIASPFPAAAPKDENEIIQPAVEGTQNVFKACVDAKSVKRIVLTSSCAAVAWETAGTSKDKVNSEEDWSDVEKLDAYSKSKTLAEKAAWDFIKELPDSDKIELAVINPSYVMGPVLSGSNCTSMEIVKRLLERAMPAVPKLNFPVIDVRDVATAHVKAMTLDEAVGHRHIISHENMYMKEMALILKAEFESQGYSVPTMNCPYFALWLSSVFDKTLKLILPQVGKVHRFDNTRMKEVLGIQPRDTKEMLIDMAYSLIEGGFVKKTKKYTGPGGAQSEEETKTEEAKEGEKKDGENGDVKVKENGEVKEDQPEGEKEPEKTEEKEAEKVEEKKEEEKKEENPTPAPATEGEEAKKE
ncbi:uncharacterized protein LOC126823846 isoform X2 [Patella vulgata]|uniref:uncharacterized protein LOC126823846 isoform X2 n=1 Tax=Patella vulgata TaxID=6465 RepID=UPI0021805065|nr:uncharacterized protein LOC126823846 isoform X2 [Patella vulgata]